MTDPALPVLDDIERIEGVPCAVTNKPQGRLTSLLTHLQRIRKDTNLDDIRVHDLRHSCASAMTVPTLKNLLNYYDTVLFPEFSQAA